MIVASLCSACWTATAPSNVGRVGGSLFWVESVYLNPVMGESCSKPEVVGIPRGPTGVGGSRKPCDGRTPQAALGRGAAAEEQRLWWFPCEE